MASLWADSRGAMRPSILSISSSVLASLRFENTTFTRLSSRPDRSKATIVLSKVGLPGFAVIASTSFSWSDIPRSKAGT